MRELYSLKGLALDGFTVLSVPSVHEFHIRCIEVLIYFELYFTLGLLEYF